MLNCFNAKRISRKSVVGFSVLLTTFTLGLSSAHAATSSGVDTIYSGNYASSAWQSAEFNGSKYRDLNNNRVTISVDHSKGGFDASFAGTFSIGKVDDVSSKFAVNASFSVSGSGSGSWWYGPKVSVNWISGNPDGLAGWYENYIIDKASRTPKQMHDWLLNDWDSGNPQNKYIGETTHDGATYKHYVFYFSDWVQYWAVRQTYRNSGTTTLKPILNKWRQNGLPNKRVDGVKFNVETHGENYRDFTITRKCIPASFTDGSCENKNTDSIAGNKRIKGGWKGRYLHAGNNWNWAGVEVLNLNTNWSSQKWVLEKVSNNVYRIKNRHTNRYLTAGSTNQWDVVKVANLNVNWGSQKWRFEKVGDKYRIKNQWSKLYLHENADNGSQLVQAPLNTGWSSQKWKLTGY
ncbi:RICIN domain-containing protein [Glaciecola siphonariae]|uniref:RICIN domain-containing protein n=1 Tax=Glaciecola siphonariae TaxID=521012 RepID=A0ABV9LT59_9ALTE